MKPEKRTKLKMFTIDQIVWIVQEATRVKSITKLMREFVKIFNLAPRDASKLQCVQFSRVIARFNKVFRNVETVFVQGIRPCT